VLIICQTTARLVAPVWGNRSIFAWLLVYWVVAGGLVAWAGGIVSIRRWAGPPRGAWGWSALALVFVPLAFYTALPSWRLMTAGWLWLAWLFFPPINSLIEEGYWRGLLLDAGGRWPGWMIILYSSLLFGVNHASLGIFVIAERSLVPIIFQVVFGLVMAVVYWKTRSLRWVVIGHALVNWLGGSMAILLNLYIPG
jgi:membrane protease YdiL (CAAX protease family)